MLAPNPLLAGTSRVNEYYSTIDIGDAVGLIQKTTGPIQVLTHAKPDGDAFGSLIALTGALQMIGKTTHPALVAPVPAPLADMPGAEHVTVVESEHETADGVLPDASLYILVDTGAWSQIGPPSRHIEANLDRTLVIDHHLSGDIDAPYRYVDGDSAATAEIIAVLIDRLLADRGGLDAATAAMRDGLFVGIASDTGWFRFSSTRPQTHELAARLIRLGTDQAELYRQLEQMERPEKVALLTRALDSLQLLCDGRAALMTLRAEDFAETGAFEEETERVIDIPQQIGSVKVIVLLAEKQLSDNGQPRTITRMSFRSKPGDDAINVADLAARFGGGGHARAAGARVDGPARDVLARITRALNDVACAPQQ